MSESSTEQNQEGVGGEVVGGGAYWTPMRVMVGAAMVALVFGVVGFVQWDEVVRITQGDERAAHPDFIYQSEGFGPLFDMSNLQVPAERIKQGQVKDGIPSLTGPGVAPVSDAGFMRDADRVVGVVVNGEARAYPIKVLNYHECYNDELGGVPIAVIYCPLCDSVSVVDRRLGGEVYEFGISGLLYNSNVLLFDRTDEGLWSQAGMMAISGPNAGKSLVHLSGWALTTFGRWCEGHGDSTVATLETGHYASGFYDRVAYADYFETDDLMFPAEPSDARFANKVAVVGVLADGEAKAYPVEVVVSSPGGRVEDELGGGRVVLESAGGAGGVRVVEVPAGARVLHGFWFAWYAFHPETGVYALE